MLPHPSPGSGLVANSPLNQMHVPSPAGLMPTSSPGPCSNVQVGHSPAGSFMQTGTHDKKSIFPSYVFQDFVILYFRNFKTSLFSFLTNSFNIFVIFIKNKCKK